MTPTARPTVLIVDDVPANIRILAEMLREDHEIHVATQGSAVQTIADRLVPDIILLDVVMPEMDGYAVCRRLKESSTTRDIPVIFVTARHEPEDEAFGLSLGAVDYIVKPASPAVVRARVKKHLELRAARLELARQNDALTEAAKLREDVDQIMRHDLKAPLNGIIGLPRILLEEGNINDYQAKLLALIEESGLKMLSMINRSLDLFKMERGTYVFTPEPVELVGFFRRIFAELTAVAESRALVFRLTVGDVPVDAATKVPMCGERLLLHTMFGNCLMNAVEASPKGGEITVDLGGVDAVVIAIHNQGAVPATIRESFFQKYVTAGKIGGTGLGTYSAKLIAAVHGGSIAMSTSEDAGTTISITLPRQAVPGGPVSPKIA